MFKFTALVFAALLAVAVASPSQLVSSPGVFAHQYVQPIVKTHYTVPVVRTVVSPVVQSPLVQAPVVHSVAAPLVQTAPLYHSYGGLVKSYAPSYGILKK